MRHLLKLFLYVLLGAGLVACASGTHRAALAPHSAVASPASPTPSQVSVAPARPLGPVLQHDGSGPAVTQLEKWLYQNQRAPLYEMGCNYDATFGPHLQAALKRWQKQAGQPATGRIRVGSTEWLQLQQEATATRLPEGVDLRAVHAAATKGWSVDADKSPSCVRILKQDPTQPHGVKVTLSIVSSYGGFIDGKYRPTVNGVFHIYAEEGPDYKSISPGNPWNGAPMAWATFFNGGDALHYDGTGPSHGCIHIPSMWAARYINHLPIGTTVVVHD